MYPPLATTTLADDTADAASNFRASYDYLRAVLTRVHDEHRTLDGEIYTYLTGKEVADFRPPLSAEYALPDLKQLFKDDEFKISLFSQKKLSYILHCSAWLDALDECHTFDADNSDAVTPHREARRLIGASQHGSGAWLNTLPDPSVRKSAIRSPSFISSAQSRLGLYQSCLAESLDVDAARGDIVTQADRLGDADAHALNKTSRHNAANDAWYDAIAAVAVRRVLKGDKGDGRRVSKAAARQRYAHINSGTVPDIIALHASPSGHHVLYESKVYSPFTPSPELGTGTRAGGGSVSTAGGHRRGFGGCEELLHVKIFGTKQRGRPGDDPFDHITTAGYVRARDGAYSDGIAKGHQVLALIL